MAFYERDRAHAAPADDSSRDVHNALISLREAIESKNAETLRNVRRMLEDYEENVAQQKVRDYVPERKRREAVQLAIAMGMPVRPDGGIDYAQTITMRNTPEYKTWFGWYSESNCHEIGTTRWKRDFDLKTLRTDVDPQGGYLIPQVMDAHIRKNISEISPVRRHARQRIAHSKTLDIPRRLSIPVAQYEGGAESAPTDQSIYGQEQVTCYRQTVNIPATLDMTLRNGAARPKPRTRPRN
jgi:HK97 family phage major capsid protein